MKKYLKNILSLAVLLVTGMFACTSDSRNHEAHQQAQEKKKAVRLTAEEVEASGPYLTYDQEKKPVLCWTEKINDQKGYILKYAVFNPATEAFGEPVSVLPSMGTRPHPESMNKVAFKADGTVVALYAVKHPTDENPFAGSILYTLSADDGKSWSDAAFLHSDTLPDYGRGYFDLATLPDGEVGACWLDGRLAEADTGSALFFARTVKGEGFEADQQIGESTCECCRTDIFTDQNGRIHMAYRDITFPAGQMGEQVRDISYSYSDDLGKTFTKAKKISADNWVIEGCPHTGPSLAADEQGLHAVWFTAGGGTGVYYTHSANYGDAFSPREAINPEARNPQLIDFSEGELVMVWNAISAPKRKTRAGLTGNQQHEGTHGSPAGRSKIMLQRRRADQVKESHVISDDGAGNATYPVILAINNNKVLIAWTQEEGENTGIYYKVVALNSTRTTGLSENVLKSSGR
jgi:hypothetical protein